MLLKHLLKEISQIELHPCAFESGGDELCTVPNALNKFIRFGQ